MRESFISKNWIMLLISEADKSEIHKAAWQSENFLGKRWYEALKQKFFFFRKTTIFPLRLFNWLNEIHLN